MPSKTDYAVPTGEYVAEWLEDVGISQAELARRMGVSAKHVSKLIAGAPLTADVAVKLELVTGVPARVWLGYEATYRADVGRLSMELAMAEAKPLLKLFPLSDLRERGFVRSNLRQPGQLCMEVLAFFGVASPTALEGVLQKQAVAFRQGAAHPVKAHALAAWLRIGELEASSGLGDLPEFNRASFEQSLGELRSLSMAPPADLGTRLIQCFRRSGVHLSFVKDIPGARVYGATRWMMGHPAIALSARGRDDGQFWFTLFHEVAHVLLHENQTHVHPADNADLDAAESAADVFASNLLIPAREVQRLRTLRSKSEVQAFARDIGTSAGVVVGRLHHDKIWPYTHGRDMSFKIDVKAI